MSTRWRYVCTHGLILIGLVVVSTAGCGSDFDGSTLLVTRVVSDPGDEFDNAAVNKVLIDWTGGVNQIYADDYFEGVDLSAFETDDGGTLADDADAFMEAVRAQTLRIYEDLPELPVDVTNGEDEDADYDVTIVHITQGLPPRGGANIGEGEYDPCNRQRDNAALLFGGRMVTLGNGYTFDEWVNVFANTVAHEVGHTLGFGHVLRSEHPDTGRTLYIELMLDAHTMAELRREQRFVYELTNCPDEID